MSRFGRKCTYVVVGDGQDEEAAAKQVTQNLRYLTGVMSSIYKHCPLECDTIYSYRKLLSVQGMYCCFCPEDRGS